MLNNSDANGELYARLYEILLHLKLTNALTLEDLKVLCYATGVQISFDKTETRLQRLQRMALEAEQAAIRG